MVKAKTTIMVKGKTYAAGQTVSGLSKLDKEWMKRSGYITETITSAKASIKTSAEVGVTDEL